MLSKDTENFWTWFDIMRGDLPIRRLEERAKSPRGRIGNAYIEKRKPTYLLCKTVAAGLNIELSEVLQQAGVFKDEEHERMIADSRRSRSTTPLVEIFENRPEFVEIINLANDLDDGRFKSLVDFTRWLSHLQHQEEQAKPKKEIKEKERY